MNKTVCRFAALLSLVGLSSSALAGGHGFVMRQGGGGGGMRIGRAMPPVAGTWHVRTGRTFYTAGGFGRFGGYGRAGGGYGRMGGGYGGGFGHTNTALTRPGFIGRPGFGGGSYGHTATAPNGFVRNPAWSRYGVHDRGRPATIYGRYPHVPAYGFGYGYGGGYGSAEGGGYVAVPYPTGGYGEPALASQYSEPALNQGSYGSYGGEAYPSVVGTGGPQVIVVHNDFSGSTCNCRSARRSPVVYRYGVGTYY